MSISMYDSREEECLFNLHIIKIGKILIDNKVPASGINKSGIRKVAITFNTHEDANEFVKHSVRKLFFFFFFIVVMTPDVVYTAINSETVGC